MFSRTLGTYPNVVVILRSGYSLAIEMLSALVSPGTQQG